jgi:glycine hydroxymethyltransferase
VNVSVNKIFVVGDTTVHGGVRIGTPAITSRGITPEHMPVIFNFLMQGLLIAKRLTHQTNINFDDFEQLSKDLEIQDLRSKVITFARKFPIPG